MNNRQYKQSNLPNIGNLDFSNNFLDTNTFTPVKEDRLGEFYDKNTRINTNEINKNKYDQNNYSTNFSQNSNKQYSVEQEPNTVYKKRDNYLTVSSKDRDPEKYPNSSQFVIDLFDEFRNISSVELITAIIPDQNNVTNEPYLLLNIGELDTVNISNNKQISESFAMLQLTPATVPGSFIQIDKRTFENTILNYHTPKARLSKMTISITDSDGGIFNFGGNRLTTKKYQSTFVFKITTLDTDRSTLNQRNVY